MRSSPSFLYWDALQVAGNLFQLFRNRLCRSDIFTAIECASSEMNELAKGLQSACLWRRAGSRLYA